MKTIISLLLLLAVVKLIHCQEHEQMIVFTLQGILENLESINNKLKGHDELLQRIPDMQEKLQHLENNLQGLSRERGQCLRGEDLEHLTIVSAAAHEEIKSFVHEEISGVISLAEKDECSEESVICGQLGTCENTLFSFTCSCPSGFTWDGSECKDVDECAEGKEDCVPNATCKNSIGSYSCSCDKPFEGDGITSCEFQCRTPAKAIRGLGCVMEITQLLTFTEIRQICQEEGGRLAQHMSLEQLQDMTRSIGSWGGWVGVYDGKYTSDGSLVPENLWMESIEDYLSDPSRLCGFVDWDSSPYVYKLNQMPCSQTRYGLCQFQMP
ncbi:uncharacterized protein [Palaemon carinicauda]|uniref:uncharacterized protein isoform X2 n=1 Tax=Palaemon carinicauda TaxID=392227 RepID=UPI0035B69660